MGEREIEEGREGESSRVGGGGIILDIIIL